MLFDKVEQKQRFFIYDRKELIVLIILGAMVAVFAFTLGIHLGKRLNPREQTHVQEAASVDTSPDKVPGRQELSEQAKGSSQAAEEGLSQALQDEVAKTGIKLDTPRQVELPEGTKGEKKSEETPLPQEKPVAPPKITDRPSSEEHREGAIGKFTLQVGSFPTLEDARSRIRTIEETGLKPFMREADLKNKGRWYRVFVGNFPTKLEAEQAGRRFQSQKVIETFIVAKLVTD